MKAGYYLNGLTLGLLIGGVIGYRIAMDPRNRVKVRRFFNDVEDKVRGVGDRIKCACGCEDADDLTDRELMEIEAVLATETIIDPEIRVEAAKVKKK